MMRAMVARITVVRVTVPPLVVNSKTIRTRMSPFRRSARAASVGTRGIPRAYATTATVDRVADNQRPIPGIGGGLRRAHMAAERTYLAWWRTALATVAMAVAIGRVLPSLVDAGSAWPYVVVGGAWGLLAVAIAAYAPVRQRHLRRAIEAGTYAHPDGTVLAVLGAGGVVLVIASAILAVVGP
jgi:uncharacterized membrane protein YidH (DUF202 family)